MNDQPNHRDAVAADQKPGYETRDVATGRIVIIMLLGIAAVVASLVIGAEVFMHQTESEIYRSVLAPESTVLRELRAREEGVLNSYGIVDTTGVGVYQIPIDRAMELVADEAYDARTGAGD